VAIIPYCFSLQSGIGHGHIGLDRSRHVFSSPSGAVKGLAALRLPSVPRPEYSYCGESLETHSVA
jgi:hypothetical protein